MMQLNITFFFAFRSDILNFNLFFPLLIENIDFKTENVLLLLITHKFATLIMSFPCIWWQKIKFSDVLFFLFFLISLKYFHAFSFAHITNISLEKTYTRYAFPMKKWLHCNYFCNNFNLGFLHFETISRFYIWRKRKLRQTSNENVNIFKLSIFIFS